MHVCTSASNCFPRRGQLEWLCSAINKDICDFMALEDDLVLYLYVGMDWRGCANIQFNGDEPFDDRGNIIVMF